MRSKSPYPHKVPTTIAFDPVVLAAMKDLSRESDRSISSLVNSLAANQLLLLGRIAFELEDDHEAPEKNFRFIEDTENSQGRTAFILDAEDTPGDGVVKSPAPSPKTGDGHPDRAGHRRERVRL